jgi:phosphate transport system substrate-binding protein
MKKSEVKICAKNGITATEIKVGYDGIVLANSKQSQQMKISLKEIFLALAAKIPQDGKLVSNPYTHWNQINPKLPNTRIRVLGPPPTSGTRDAFVELAMEGGAKKFGWLKDLRKKDKKKFKAIAHNIREDGAYVEAGENDNLIIKKLDSDPSSFGVFGFSFLDQNIDKIQGSVIQGVAPTFDSIADGSYKVSRPLFIYAKDQHMGEIPGMKDFIKLYISEKMTGEEGRLADGGLIPLPAREKAELVKKLFAALQ